MNAEVENQLDTLEDLIRDMDVPEFRRRKVPWLSRNLAVRNSDHPNFPAAMEIVEDLMRQGVR
jgi:hypothetical protein